MRMKNTITASQAGTPSHIVVLSAKRASRVTAKENPRTAREKRHLTQKKRFCAPLRGSSRDSILDPARAATVSCTT